MIDLKLVMECVQKIKNAPTLDEAAQVIVTILSDRNYALADKELFEKRWNDTVERCEQTTEKLHTAELQVNMLKKLNVDDLTWAINKNAALITALQHELSGSYPCSFECEPGGWRKCTGCDKRAKLAIQGRIEKRKDEPCPKCGAFCLSLPHNCPSTT